MILKNDLAEPKKDKDIIHLYSMFNTFVHLLNSKGVMKTVLDGDCFFDTLHKITGLYTRRGWRTLLAKRMLNKKAFSVHEYKAYIHSKTWADYDVVFEAVRTLNRPVCVVQLEMPNAVMWIRPDKVKPKDKDILYLVYDHGSHFTSFITPTTPPELLKRLKALEKTGMHEEELGLVVTHGNLRDLLYDPVNDVPVNLGPVNLEPVKETNIEKWMKQYETNRSVEGTSVKGTSVKGTSVKGTSVKGTSVKGTSVKSVKGTKAKTRKKPVSKKREMSDNLILKTNSAYAESLQAQLNHDARTRKNRSNV